MIRAILKKGKIQPLDELPKHWREGQELIVEGCEPSDDPADIKKWHDQLVALSAQIPAEDHERMADALAEWVRQPGFSGHGQLVSRTPLTRRSLQGQAPIKHPQIRQASAERARTVRRASAGARLANTKPPTRLAVGVQNLYGWGHHSKSQERRCIVAVVLRQATFKA